MDALADLQKRLIVLACGFVILCCSALKLLFCYMYLGEISRYTVLESLFISRQ